MAFHRDSSAVSCGLLVVTLGAWNLVFWLLCWPELYANFFFEAGLCAPQGVPAIVPYRHCDSRCVGCGRCGYGQRRCVDVLAEHRRSDPHDLARSASLAGPCCGGYHCCRQSCRTRCRRRSLLALDDEVVDEIVDEWVVIDGTDAIVDGTNASEAARDERRKLRGAHSRGRGRSSCHTVCSCAHAVLNRMCAVGCVEYVEVATAIRVDGATLGAAGAHVNLVRDFRGDRAAAQRELGRPELRAPSAACFYDPALARHTDALEVSAAELRFGAEMGYTWWRWLLLAAVSAPFVAGCFAAVAAAAAERRGATVRSIARATAAGGSQPRFAAAPPAAPVATAWPVAPPEPGVALPPAGLYPTFDAPPPPIAQAQPAEPGAVGPVAVAQPVGGGPVAAAQPVDGGGLSVAERYRTGRRRVPYGAEVRE
jgi:hypothetical protein